MFSRLRLSLKILFVVGAMCLVVTGGTSGASAGGNTVPTFVVDEQPNNSSSSTETAGDRSYAWQIFNSGATPWIPPHSDFTSHGNYFKSDDGTTWWGAMSIRVDQPVPNLSRLWNFHILDGYPGWSSGYAHSPDAVDLIEVNGQTVLRFSVDGGGEWDPAIQFYRDTNKLNGKEHVDYPIAKGVRQDIVLEIRFASDNTGVFGAWVNGKVAVPLQAMPTMYPGVSGVPAGNSEAATGLMEIVGGYQAYQIPTQAHEGYWFSAPRWGTSLATALANVPVANAPGDHSVLTRGYSGSASSLTPQAAFDTSLFQAPGAAPPNGPPTNVAAPALGGAAQVGATLTAALGTWSGSPTSYAYLWQHCDTMASTCSDVSSAGSTYVAAIADVGSVLRVKVTATNGAGSASAMSAATAVVQSVPVSPSVSVSLDRPLLRQADVVVGKDPGCAACSIAWSGSGFVASVQGGADTLDTAMASVDLGVGGWAARTYSRDLLGLPSGETLGGNLAVLQELDAKGNLIYELYLAGDRSLNLWSPAGGLRAASVNVSTGVIVPNNGSTVAVEVSAQANNSVIVRVNGSDRVTLTGFAGANTGNPRYLGAGVDHYDTKGTSDGKTVNHSQLGITTLGWLNARTS